MHRKIDSRRRDLYREARELGFSTDAIKRIAQEKHDGEVKTKADDLLAYLGLLHKEAPERFKAGESFSTVAFGDAGWPCDFVG
jgi:DNA-binding transcriptional MerR regulator